MIGEQECSLVTPVQSTKFLPLSTPHKAPYVTFGRKKAPAGNILEGLGNWF